MSSVGSLYEWLNPIFGNILNFLVVITLLRSKSPTLKGCHRILLTCTISQLIFVWLYNAGQFKIEIINGHVFIIVTSPLKLLPYKVHYFLYAVFTNILFTTSNMLVCEVYYTRQMVFENYRMTIEDIQKFTLCSVFLGILLSLWGVYCAMETGNPGDYIELFSNYPQYFINNRSMDYLVLNKDLIGFKIFFGLVVVLEGTSFILSFYWGRYIYLDIYNKDTKIVGTMSKDEQDLAKIILIHGVIVIVQALIPMITVGVAILANWKCDYLGTIVIFLRNTIPITYPLSILLSLDQCRSYFRGRIPMKKETGTFTDNVTYMS